MSVQPGWYVDPADPETRRYWDGEGWIGAPIPVGATPPEGPPPPEPEPVAPEPQPVAPEPQPGQPTAGPQPGQPGPGWPAGSQWPGYPPAPGHPQGPPAGWPHPTWPGRLPTPRPHGLPLASYGARLAARLIDFGMVLLLNAVVNGWFVYRFSQEVAPYLRAVVGRSLAGNTSTEGLPTPGGQADGLLVAILVIATALWFAYDVPSMAARGQTFGKRVMRVRALPVEADQPLGFGRATRRWSTLGMPTLLWYCCGFGLLLQFLDAISPLFDQPLRQALHDKRAQTVVVRLPRERERKQHDATPDTRTTPRDRANPPGDTP